MSVGLQFDGVHCQIMQMHALPNKTQQHFLHELHGRELCAVLDRQSIRVRCLQHWLYSGLAHQVSMCSADAIHSGVLFLILQVQPIPDIQRWILSRLHSFQLPTLLH